MAGRGTECLFVKISDLRNILTSAVETEYRGASLEGPAERLVKSLGRVGLSPDDPIFEAQEEVSLALENTAPTWLTNAIK